ncbi:MAG: nitroreductase [Halothiobacillus sp.]|jgi:nitroreductase|nr:nitroreductase [Halothiobacillus sp.]
MDFIDFIQQRQSTPPKYLVEPTPTHDELQRILQTAESAPDHGALHPWRFLVIDQEQRDTLGDLFVHALLRRAPDTDPSLLERERERALRAPMLIAAIANITNDHPKIPAIEQFLAAAAATQQVMLAANHLGYGTVWLTGNRIYDRFVMTGMGLSESELLLGLINVGTASVDKPIKMIRRSRAPVDYWRP